MTRTSNDYYKHYESVYLKKKNSIKKDILFISIFIVIGIIIGNLFYFLFSNSLNNNTLQTSSIVVDNRLYGNFFTYIKMSLTINLKFILMLLVLSLTPICTFVAPFLLVIKGVGIGVVSSYLYSILGFSGVLSHLFLFVPLYIISSIFLIYITKNCIKISNKIKSKLIKNVNHDITKVFKYYYSIILKLVISMVVFLIVEACLTYLIRIIII